MVREKVPVPAVLVALSVRTLVLVVLAGLNEEAVTPLGRPETDSATLPVKPFCGVTVMVLVPLPPCVSVYGDADRLKFGTRAGALTVRLTVVVWLKVPEVPVMVTVDVPVIAVLLAVSVMMLPAKDEVTPLGRPEAAKATLPMKPFRFVTVMVLVPLAPCITVRLVGEADRLKFGTRAGALTVRLTVVVWLKVPEVPVMVTVDVPVIAEVLAASVMMLPAKDEVTPLGRPEAAKATLPVKPFRFVTVMVLVPLAPCITVRLVGDADRLKFGTRAGALTVRLTVVVWLKVP